MSNLEAVNSTDPTLLPVVRDGAVHGISPIDLSPLAPVAVTDAAGVKAAVERARAAQVGWSRRPFAERVEALTRVANTILDRRAEVIALMRQEVGKLEVDALMSEVLGPLDQVKSWASVIGPELGPQKASLNPIAFPKKKATVEHVARGVIGIIAPWNFPVATLFRNVIPALLTGNAVVLKPSEYSVRTQQWFAARFAEVLSPGTIEVVVGGRETGIALIEAGIDACVFTGSVAAGRDVSRRCGERLIPCSAELGGKDAAIVLGDCDLERTAAGLTQWALQNVGQACGAVEIAYVEERVADRLVATLEKAFSRLKVGPGAPGEVDLSPLSNPRQLALVEAQVEDARAKGARVVAGGTRLGQGLWYLPTLLDRCTDRMTVVTDETFGPVLAIVRVESAADAVRQVEASRYGLTASIWTSDVPRATRLAEQLSVGTVTINNHGITGAMSNLPWSGHKETGTGIANSKYSLPTYLRPRTLLIDNNADPDLYWFPYDTKLWEFGNLIAEAQRLRLRSAYKIPFLLKGRIDAVRRFFGAS